MEESLKKTIEKSGNNLHIRVVEVLKASEWDTDLSVYYYDDTTNKPREIDIIASKKYSGENAGGKYSFKAFLFIECKYFQSPIAFRTEENSEGKGMKAIIMEGFNKDEILRDSKNHHYLRPGIIGKLYDTVDDENNVFNAITQPVKSLTFFKDKKSEKGLYYPIVIYAGVDGFYILRSSDISNLDSVKKEENIIFELNYAYKNATNGDLKSQTFFVDFINENNLGKLLDVVEGECKTLKNWLAY